MITLIQGSFFPPLEVPTLNMVVLSVLAIDFFEDREDMKGWLSAFVGGFFLDIFSCNFLGYHIIILFFITLFIKLVLKKVIR